MSIGYAWLTVVFLCKAGAQPVSLPSAPGSKADDVPKMGHPEPNSQLFQLNLPEISDFMQVEQLSFRLNLSPVIAGLDPAIHLLTKAIPSYENGWMRGSSLRMTPERVTQSNRKML